MNRTPVDEAAFAQIAELFRYDAGLPLDAVTIGTWSSRTPYVIEKVAYSSTRGQRVPGYFAHPQDESGALRPAILLVHGANDFWGKNEDWAMDWLDILARSGRCVLCIDNTDYGERRTKPGNPRDQGPYVHRDWMVQTVTDQRRGVDYLRCRPEVDPDRIALLGGSLGGHIGSLVAGLDDRFAAVVLTVVGAWVKTPTDDLVERYINMLNFAPRVSAPVLMVNAVGDGKEPGEELFGAMPEPRKQIWYESNHYLAPREYNADILAWLDGNP